MKAMESGGKVPTDFAVVSCPANIMVLRTVSAGWSRGGRGATLTVLAK